MNNIDKIKNISNDVYLLEELIRLNNTGKFKKIDGDEFLVNDDLVRYKMKEIQSNLDYLLTEEINRNIEEGLKKMNLVDYIDTKYHDKTSRHQLMTPKRVELRELAMNQIKDRLSKYDTSI